MSEPFEIRLEGVEGPHASAALLRSGAEARTDAGEPPAVAVLLLHGRGATAESMLELAREWETEDVLFVAPAADSRTWYPHRFLAPLDRNEPHLSSALSLVSSLGRALAQRGVPPERQVILGFSQGGCLALEWSARNARRFGGLAGLSAGLIGPPGTKRTYDGSLEGTPVFLGCGVPDPHIPRDRVEESAQNLQALGGRVHSKLYPGLGHAVNADEIAAVRRIIVGARDAALR